jgi:hypothetical protein
MSSPNGNGKDVIYIDVDDEITGVIDKVTNATARVVALVLPKRATVFQSIVNMKLLKKRADAAKKHIVLITSEAGLMPLAGTVGLYVASTLQSKPEIPDVLNATSEVPEEIDEGPIAMGGQDLDTDKDGKTPVGALAASHEPSIANTMDDDDGTVELDNSELPDSAKNGDINALAAAGGSGKAAKKEKKDKSLSVPNFKRFKLWGMIAVLLIILLIVGFFVANSVLAKANIGIKTNTSQVNASLSPTLDTNATTLDPSKNTIPAQTQQQTKTATEQVSASGKQNQGNKASGSIVLSAQACISSGNLNPPVVPAGTGVSANGLTFITQSDAQFNINGHTPQCINYQSDPVNISAQSGGTQYNVDKGTSFTVAGQSGVNGSGSATGGTDNIVTVVQQSDIDSATNKVKSDLSSGVSGVKSQLEQNLQSNGLYPIQATFFTGTPNISTSVQAGTQANNVTVTDSVTYTMYGAKQSDIQTLLDNNIDSQIDQTKQSIQSDGLSQSAITVPNAGTGSTLDLSVQTTAIIGPRINIASLKKQVAGKPSGDVKQMIMSLPGVTDVQVSFSPFWVSKAPGNPSKINITFEK